MIKLKSILNEIFHEAAGNLSGEYELDIELDGIHIPGLLRPEDLIKIKVTIPYDIDPGYSERGQYGHVSRAEQGEGASVELSDSEITDMAVQRKGEQEDREIEMRFVHPNQRKTIEDLVEDYIEKNKGRIMDSILERLE